MAEFMNAGLDEQVEIVGKAWAESPYYENAERWTHLFWAAGTEFRSLFDKLDLTSVVELACGHGRHSEQIAQNAGHITMIDIFDENLNFCRERLAQHTNIDFLKGDGKSFQPLNSESVTSVFCYDAMVHFSPDLVRSYLVDTARLLKRGGMALYHHSNYPAPLDQHYGQNPHARNHMTVKLFQEYATASGLIVADSQVIRWGEYKDLDGLTLLLKPTE